MKKSFLLVSAIVLLFATSCKKETTTTITPPPANYGTWAFKNVTFTSGTPSTSSSAGISTVSGTQTVTGTVGYSIRVHFSGSLPASSGTYTVVSGLGTGVPSSGQATIGITTAAGTYSSTGGGGGSVTVTVSGSNIKISGTAISMINDADLNDQGTVTITGLSN